MFTNQLNNDVTVQKRAKIYKLWKYIGEKNRQEKDYNIFANIGITFLNDNEYLIVVLKLIIKIISLDEEMLK
ncbi:hypothetical protein ONA00_00940 [Mycoplasmopsis cynos]|uniref:hypothetical protein n=1 Tax=Mycoplasmopsis cynos TaxID=171284 RepID=UPI0024C94ECC|nr:hypothetical protein [Mycoplasmopsis cynos]WAM11079.1 hypothetical protein ONA00_00940 [Mycoplasmopsis cynos]